MAKANIKFLGKTSRGNFAKYEVVAKNADELKKVKKELEDAGVTFNPNVADGNGFLSRTHLHSTPKENDTADADVEGFMDDSNYGVNWFPNVDKDKQDAFAIQQRQIAENKRAQADILEYTAKEKALEVTGSSIDVIRLVDSIKNNRRQDRELDEKLRILNA